MLNISIGSETLSPLEHSCLSPLSLPSISLFGEDHTFHFTPIYHSHTAVLLHRLRLLLYTFHPLKMMLGKRPRPHIRRTTSMTGITVDVGNLEGHTPVNPQNPINNEFKALEGSDEHFMLGPIGYDQRSMALLSPRYYRRGAGDNHIETAQFLRTCGLCNRRLAPGRDIYMYRGDTAFCSLECREQQMKQDERKEKCKMAVSEIGENHHNHSQVATAASPRGLR